VVKNNRRFEQKRQPTLNGPRKFKASINSKERIWREADRLRAAHRAGCALPVKVFDLAEFDLHLDLVPVNGLREQLDMDALLMGDLNPSLWTPIPEKYAIIHL